MSQFSDTVMDKNSYWMALKYTKPLQFKITPALKDSDRNMAVSMKVKEALVQKSAFPKPPGNFVEPLVISSGIAHIKINKKVIAQALMTQTITKAPSADKINFQTLQMI